jgi:aldehyde:ferredoxin oxidoreductase
MHKLLVVDLTKREFKVEPIPEAILDDYLGGRGLGAYLLYTNIEKGVDPLSPENPLIFSSGPAQGTDAYYGSRVVLNCKSPLTGIYLYSVASGRFGHEMKRAGYMALMVKGRAAEPTYVVIQDNRVDFRPASGLWGMKTVEAQEALLNAANLPKASCVAIGPAGERLVKTACVVTGGESARTFGRGGSGAVMGSKNLKGIVLSGSGAVSIANTELYTECKGIVRENVKAKEPWARTWQRFGSTGDILSLNELGILPTRNFQTGMFGQVRAIAPTELKEIWPDKGTSCGPNCLTPCAHFVEMMDGQWKGSKIEGPEYETLYSFGSDCGVDDFGAIVAAAQICDEYGIDTISCGATVAFAMECYEKGLISNKDTGGLDLRFGNSEALVKVVEMIANSEGIGVLLGAGTLEASKTIPGSSGFAMHCKGMEFGGYECRGMWGQALQFALSSRGGCHHAYGLPARTPADTENGTKLAGKGNVVKGAACGRILYDSAVMCSFGRITIGPDNVLFAKIINAITGKSYIVEDLMKIGFRVMTLERMFNAREGLLRKDDYLPRRFVEEPLPDGPRKGSVVPMEELLDEGYQALGWDKATGIPLKETLAALSLAVDC